MPSKIFDVGYPKEYQTSTIIAPEGVVFYPYEKLSTLEPAYRRVITELNFIVFSWKNQNDLIFFQDQDLEQKNVIEIFLKKPDYLVLPGRIAAYTLNMQSDIEKNTIDVAIYYPLGWQYEIQREAPPPPREERN